MMDLHSSGAVFYYSALVSVGRMFLKTNILNLKQVHIYLFGWWVLSQTLGLPLVFLLTFPSLVFYDVAQEPQLTSCIFFFSFLMWLCFHNKSQVACDRVVAGVSKWKWVKPTDEDKNGLVNPGLDFRAGLGYHKLYELHYEKGSLRVLILFGSYFNGCGWITGVSDFFPALTIYSVVLVSG